MFVVVSTGYSWTCLEPHPADETYNGGELEVPIKILKRSGIANVMSSEINKSFVGYIRKFPGRNRNSPNSVLAPFVTKIPLFLKCSTTFNKNLGLHNSALGIEFIDQVTNV
jgi:hypothetical protein